MAVDSFDSAHIENLSSSSREVLCRQSWWHRWSVRQFKCSHAIVLTVWPACLDDLFSIRNESYGSHLLVLALLPHLRKVVDLSQSVKLPVLHISLHFQVIVSICRIQCLVITCQYPVIGPSRLPYDDIFAKGFACGFWQPPADNVLSKGKTGLHSNTMWYDREYIPWHIGEIGVLPVCFILLMPPVGDIRWPKWTTNYHRVGVGINKIRIIWLPVLWSFRLWIQMVPSGSQ